METKTGWRIDRRKKSIKIIDANFYPIASIIKEEDAALIVKAVNNHYDLVEALTNMVAFYEGDANLAYIDKAKELLNNINESK